MKLMKYVSGVLVIAFLLIVVGCSKSSDYECTLTAGQVITNPDGTQYTVTDTETKSCSDCTTSDVQKLEDQGYSCTQ
jgi:hypothetical protein